MSVDCGNIESSSGEPSKLITQRIQVADANVGGAQVAHSNLPGQVDDDLVNQPVTAVGGNKHSPVRASDRGNEISHDEPLKGYGGSDNNTDLDKNVKRGTLDFAEPARKLALDIATIGVPVLPLVEETVQQRKILKPLPGAEATADPLQINKWFEDLIGVRALVATARERIEQIRNVQKKYWEADREMERAARVFHECKQLIEIGCRVLSGEIDLDTATDLLPSMLSWGSLDDKKAICRKATREIERNKSRYADAAARINAAAKAKSETPFFQYNDVVSAEEKKSTPPDPRISLA